MNRYTVLTLGLALALPCVGARANQGDNNGAANQGTQLQAPATPDQNQAPATNAPADQNPAPPNTAPPDQNAAPPANPPADQNQAPPNNAAPNNPPNAVPPPTAVPETTQPNAAPTNTAPANTAPASSPTYTSTLQQFVSDNVNEVGMLSQQIDQMRAAKRPEAVMALYHMIRDHTLLADAARNVLARRGENSEPTVVIPASMPTTPDEMIKRNLDEHQQTLSQLQQLLANASTPEEKNIYQRAVNVTNKHLSWMTAMNQGQPVQIGFFGPTTPLNRIAGYREERAPARVASYRQSGTMPARHHRRHRRHRRAHYYR